MSSSMSSCSTAASPWCSTARRSWPRCPSFMAVADSCLALPALLGGGTSPEQLAVADFALNGVIAECRDHRHTDESLRALLQTCMRRLLL